MKSYYSTFIIIPIIASILGLSAFQDKNPMPVSEAELGKLLFFDPILSQNKKISCATCHKEAYGFADNVTFSFGIDSIKTKRNTPTVKNVLARNKYFWDGRATTLEEQALMPIENHDEMNLSLLEAYKRLNADPFYKKAFKKIYRKKADKTTLASAIASYERTLESTFTAWDRYAEGDDKAISASAIRGRDIFMEEANCFECHFGPDFTVDEMVNIGIYNGIDLNDKGLGGITGKAEDMGKFKVPGLRNIIKTAPYMHNGMFSTLREVIEYYNNPDSFIPNSINTDARLRKPLNLTEEQKVDLEAFLNALSD